MIALALAFEVFAPETGFACLLRRDPGHRLYVKNSQCGTPRQQTGRWPDRPRSHLTDCVIVL